VSFILLLEKQDSSTSSSVSPEAFGIKISISSSSASIEAGGKTTANSETLSKYFNRNQVSSFWKYQLPSFSCFWRSRIATLFTCFSRSSAAKKNKPTT
jgi:hypothetical protein